MFKKIVGHKIQQTLLDNKFTIAGIVICIGSVGLLLGGITCTIASIILMKTDLDLTVAMMIGFYSTWLLGTTVGVSLIALNK